MTYLPKEPQIVAKNLETDIRLLSTRWPTRHTLSRNHVAIVEYLQGRLKTLGLRVQRHAYQKGEHRLYNVVGTKAGGVGAPILLCAHFDSRQEDLGAPEAPAPGADDNATGVAIVLELARVLQTVPLKAPLRIVLFSGEEQGLWGSTAYAAECKARREAFRYIFNLDQVGYPNAKREIFLDRDEGGSRRNNAASARLVARLEQLARDVVKVPTRVDPAEGSDYIPFEAQGYTVTGLYEGEYRYPHYHKATDTYDKVDIGYVTDMARLALAFLRDDKQ